MSHTVFELGKDVFKVNGHIVSQREYCNTVGNCVNKLQSENEQLKAEVEMLRKALETTLEWSSYQTECDGQMITICSSCCDQDGEHSKNCELPKLKALASTNSNWLAEHDIALLEEACCTGGAGNMLTKLRRIAEQGEPK